MSLETTKKSQRFPTLGKSNGLAWQLCVLARFPANVSSLGTRQTKQRFSRWCGVALRMSMATRSHPIPHEKFKHFPVDFEWVVAISVNKLLGSLRAKLQKNLPKQSPTVLVRERAIKAPLDQSISAIVVASCCRLSLECRQNCAMWRWKLVLNVKGRFWKQRKVHSMLIWCAIWWA